MTARVLLLATIMASFTPARVSSCRAGDREMEMERLFKADFAGFRPPDAARIRAGAVHRAFPNASYDDVWHALLLVTMQRQVIVSSSKETGILVAMQIPTGRGQLLGGFPTVMLLERNGAGEIEVFCNWPEEYYTTTGRKPELQVKLRGLTKERLANGFLDQVINQATTQRRWGYLR